MWNSTVREMQREPLAGGKRRGSGLELAMEQPADM